jgi:cellobiose phosphorylase
MRYGYFDDAKREYVITDPKTPVKWINYIGQLSFGGFVDHTGGSVICKRDPSLNRILKYIPQMPSSDFKGETLYIRLKDKEGKYQVFSPYFVPTLTPYETYECRVGLGYSRFISEFYGIQFDIIVFVPINESRVIRDIKITNKNKYSVDIDAIPVVEYSHFEALMQLTNADWVPQTMQSRIHEEDNHLKVLTQFAFMKKNIRTNYFTSNLPISSFQSDRKLFLGANEYGSWVHPQELQNEELSNYEAHRGDNIAALLHHLGTFKPGETKSLITQLGQEDTVEKAMPRILKYRESKNVDAAFHELGDFWNDYLSKMQVETPDVSMNTMLNIHNPRQCYITKNWSRYLSLYQLGYGSDRGIGFRDASQDVMGIIANAPEEGKDLIKKLLSIQKRDGSAMHQFNPLTMAAGVGDSNSREFQDRPKYYSDDHLWIILAVCAYIKETGNISFLDEVIPYYEKNKHDKPLETSPVLDHLKRGIEFTKNDIGDHGLPLLGFADWNDTINLKKGAESVFTANLYGKAILEMIELMEHLNLKEWVEKYKTDYKEIKDKVNKQAWDGKWYVRYFDFDGTPLGSNKNLHGKIYINAQSWSVISEFAPLKRGKQALESVNKILNTKNGIKMSYPSFNGFDQNKGGVTTYPPGAKENGGIFLHTNPWVIIAETILGNGDRAYEYYNQINPAAKNDKIDEFECAPYCYPQNILGDEHPQFGLARNSWLSGTASWCYQATTKHILGIQPDYNGLKIDPCIPKKWKGFKAMRAFRNSFYEIEVKNPKHVSRGVKSIKIDGKIIKGNIAPIFNDGKEHLVEVIMG